MATIRVTFDTKEFASAEEAAQFAADVTKGGIQFAYNLLWSHRIACEQHMTAAAWAELKDLAHRLGVDIPC